MNLKIADGPHISPKNVGKIAERIVANELEAHGYRVTDLNKEGLSANADLLASKAGQIWQIQVKGMKNDEGPNWRVQLGYCTPEIIAKSSPMFNQHDSFYTANFVCLVAVKSPSQYRCFNLPIKSAERLAQSHLDRTYRTPKKNGEAKKPGKVWLWVEMPTEKIKDEKKDKERQKLSKCENFWQLEGN